MPVLIPLNQVSKYEKQLVGDKALSLGQLLDHKLRVPKGFVLTTETLRDHFQSSGLKKRIQAELGELDREDIAQVERVSQRIRQAILATPLDANLSRWVCKAYEDLGSSQDKEPLVAIRSSYVPTSIPISTGDHPLFLHVQGKTTLTQMIKEMGAYFFGPYFLAKVKDPLASLPAVIVQQMVMAKASGFIHTPEAATGSPPLYTIEAIWGFGEYLVQNYVKGDTYQVDANSLEVIKREIVPQTIQLTFYRVELVQKEVPTSLSKSAKLTKNQIQKLTGYAQQWKRKVLLPQTLEWTFDGKRFYFLQSQRLGEGRRQSPALGFPREVVTTHSKKAPLLTPEESPPTPQPASFSLPSLAQGIGIVPGIGIGHITLVCNIDDAKTLRSSDVAVVAALTPELAPWLRHGGAIITQSDSLGSVGSSLARELAVPTVGMVEKALTTLRTQQLVTVDGTYGVVYLGQPNLRAKELVDIQRPPMLPKISFNLPCITQLYADLPSGQTNLWVDACLDHIEGVMGIRGEVLMAQTGIHPKQFLMDGKKKTLVNFLKRKLEAIVKRFEGSSIWYRLADWRSDGGVTLDGGKQFEAQEPNPLLGYRGSLRHLADREVFDLELDAIGPILEANPDFHLVLPLIRSTPEILDMVGLLKQRGITSAWLQLQTPANLINLPQYLELGLDGFIVSLSELTQLVLGVDRLNPEVMPLYQPLDPSVLWLLHHAVRYANTQQVPIILQGDVLGRYPELVESLVAAGVTGFSVPPDLLHATRLFTAKAEYKTLTIKLGTNHY